MKFRPETLNLINELRGHVGRLKSQKAESRARLKTGRQCTGITKAGGRCRAWSVWDDPSMNCGRHGGKKVSGSDACRCRAYQFPHRRRGGLCNYPEAPLGVSKTPQGKRRYYKRTRKQGDKRWLKEIEL